MEMSAEVDIHARFGMTAWVGWLAFFALSAFAQAPVAGDADLHVRVIDVGHGNAIVAKMPATDGSGERDHHYLVYDTGRWEDRERRATLEAIGQVIPRWEVIDLMVLSHGDWDHIGGVPAILGAYQVGKIIRPGKNATITHDNLEIWEEADRAIRTEGAEVLDLSERDVPAGTRFQFGETTLTLVSGFSVPRDEWGELQPTHVRNSPSVVIRLDFAGRSVLFAGDAIGCEHYEIDECDRAIATEKYMLGNSDSVRIKSDVIIGTYIPNLPNVQMPINTMPKQIGGGGIRTHAGQIRMPQLDYKSSALNQTQPLLLRILGGA